MKTADQARHNGNYIDAANRYHSAKETARKLLIYKNLYLKAYCSEGDSYLLAGINSDDQNYYAHAFGIYGDVMDNHKFESSEYYNHVYTTILNLLSKDNLELSYYNDYTSDTIYTVQLLVLLANNSQVENADKYANQAINICEKELKRLSLNEYDISTYISLKYLISASNVALGNFYSDNKILSESYLKTAHDELISLLDLCKENVPIEQKTDIAYQVLFTKKCTANDLQKILEVYQELFNQINVSEDPKQAANWALNICAACKYVNDTYGFSSQFRKIGQAVTELVIEDYIQNTQKEVYGSFKDYFHPDINTNTESLFP